MLLVQITVLFTIATVVYTSIKMIFSLYWNFN